MNEKWKSFRRWLIGISCCALILGIVMVIWPQISATALCWTLGILSIGVGIYEIIRYFQLGIVGLFFRLDLILGICNILIGIFLVLPFSGSTILPLAAGLYVLEGSIFNIQLAISMSKYNLGSWIATLLLGIAGLIFSIFLFVDPFQGTTALMIFMGVSLMLNGVQGLYDVACLSKAIRISSGPKVIDAKWESVE